MKRLISLLMLLVIFFTLCACTKDEPIKPNSQTSTENSTSPSQTNDSNKENQTSGAPINTGVGYLDPNKKLMHGQKKSVHESHSKKTFRVQRPT